MDENTIQLDQFLKLQGIAGTGGQAKLLVQGGVVSVNGVVEQRRRRKLQPGDVVEVAGDAIDGEQGGVTLVVEAE